MNQFLANVKDILKNQSALLLKPFGMSLLNPAQSETRLSDYRIYNSESQNMTLNQVADVLNPDQVLFESKTIVTAPAYVWQYLNTDKKASLLRNGGLRLGADVLNTDFGNSALLKDVLKFDKRRTVQTELLIAPWSHYWGGYYDYLIFVAAKLYRIKKVLPAAEFEGAIIAYPLLNTTFERELLTLLDCPLNNVVDSRTTDVQFARCISGNSGSWFYPSATDLFDFKKYMAIKLPPIDNVRKRIYISRSGRRRIMNEDALICLLETYGFVIIEDKPRSVIEQYQLYSNASFVIGPHGASFANTLWCEPGTYLFELFADGYMPEYFRYMAQLLGLRYSAYCPGSGSAVTSHYSNMTKDIHVSIDEIENRLSKILKPDSFTNPDSI